MGDGACKNEQPAVKFSCLCDLDRPISTEKDGGDRGTGQGVLVQRRVSRHLSAWGERLTDGRRQLADRTLQRVPSEQQASNRLRRGSYLERPALVPLRLQAEVGALLPG